MAISISVGSLEQKMEVASPLEFKFNYPLFEAKYVKKHAPAIFMRTIIAKDGLDFHFKLHNFTALLRACLYDLT